MSLMEVYESPSGHFLLFKCANRKHMEEEPNDKSIPKFYNYKHAFDEGWRFTKDKRWSIDGKHVVVCPTCAKEINWDKIKLKGE